MTTLAGLLCQRRGPGAVLLHALAVQVSLAEYGAARQVVRVALLLQAFRQVKRCPSGALSLALAGASEAEAPDEP